MTCRRLHAVVITHTTRHLEGTLAGLARQTRAPDTVTLSTDVDDAAIGDIVQAWSPDLAKSEVRWVRRPFTGEARPAQTRNNAVRALQAAGLLADGDSLLMLDGDMVLNDNGAQMHHELIGEGCDVVIPFRSCFDPRETEAFDARKYFKREFDLPSGEKYRAELHKRQRRYERQARQRIFPWTKAHKPKVIGCHLSMVIRSYKAVNGFDEEYTGYASEDDDVSRRLNQLRPRTRLAIAVERITAFHLWHPTRGGNERKTSDAYMRFQRTDLPTYSRYGLDNPLPQDEPIVDVL